eukprot:TRINITY_DN3412_c0_g2_i1.p6 TRINITY_DN3412_c0_g2~~TRINITY_DN3412_c0_g2_i1.p6  ORF type:complete len:124 (-),score=39.13 TRINITY_DN3412_c0_g2_i1:1101-1472(-)
MVLAQAACKSSLKRTSSFGAFCSIGVNFLYYAMFRSKARDAGEKFLVEGRPEQFVKFWNLPDTNSCVRFFLKKILPSVKTKQVIYAPKLLEPLTLEDLSSKTVRQKSNTSPAFVLLKGSYDPE